MLVNRAMVASSGLENSYLERISEILHKGLLGMSLSTRVVCRQRVV